MATKTMEELVNVSGVAARSMVAVIDAMAGRGSFKGEELGAIAQLRDQSTQIIKLAETVQEELAEDSEED